MNLRLPCFALLLLLTACNRKSDAQLQAKLPGTWTNSHDYIDSISTSRNTVRPTGAFDCQVVTQIRSNGATLISTLSGKWEVHNGLLIETITKHSQTNAPLPMVVTSSIVRLDAHELAIKDLRGSAQVVYTDEIILHKVEK